MTRRIVRMETFKQRTTREALEAFRIEDRRVAISTRRMQAQQLARAERAAYQCPELDGFAGRPGAMRAFALPSRIGTRLFHPDGRVTDLQGQPLEA